MATCSPPLNTASLSAILLPIIGTIDIDSVPAAMTTSSSPVRMRSAASATACTPEEQKRLMVIAGTVSGSPARSTPMRATFMPCSASGIAQPTITSAMSWGSSPGTCARAPLSTCASMSSGRTLRNMPRGALPTGVRTAATMYASWTCRVMVAPSGIPEIRKDGRQELQGEDEADEADDPLLHRRRPVGKLADHGLLLGREFREGRLLLCRELGVLAEELQHAFEVGRRRRRGRRRRAGAGRCVVVAQHRVEGSNARGGRRCHRGRRGFGAFLDHSPREQGRGVVRD